MFAFLRIFFLLRVKAKNKVNMWIALQTLALHSKEKKGKLKLTKGKNEPKPVDGTEGNYQPWEYGCIGDAQSGRGRPGRGPFW